jgi:hypothetical protein
MLKSEQDEEILYEAFHSFGNQIEKKVGRQNRVIAVILCFMLVGAIVLFFLTLL